MKNIAPKEKLPVAKRKLTGLRFAPNIMHMIKAMADVESKATGELLELVFAEAIEGRSYFATEDGKIPADKKAQITNLKKAFHLEAR